MSEQMITSKSKTISMVEIRQLREMTNVMGGLLTKDELVKIMCVYVDAGDRLLKENGLE